MIRTLIIDDETHIRDTLTKLLSQHCHQVSVVGEASGVADGIKAIRNFHPDLVLLDIILRFNRKSDKNIDVNQMTKTLFQLNSSEWYGDYSSRCHIKNNKKP